MDPNWPEVAANRSLEKLRAYPPGVLGPAGTRLLKALRDEDKKQ